ncbi:unnamed protein product [Ostreobium quekettii]|uniref:Uncharacterized protein n=1 Tax=Ostreobium quekettii TaxID=121088 RepID=A0A8S1IK93_9CHLO|nr:unnamed protein product [Ostreobium quekettii]CAD7699324.1 unnamed protein product [Ostreobium quekettii]|eukprot:evm.model.scf_349.5 EVM.evm.TU.scf_349.5   scf_349:68705-71443(+)
MSQECEVGSRAEVVLIDPPCLVAERDCDVDIHFSREVHVRKMALTRDGTLMANAPSAPQMTKTIRVSVPAIESCCVCVDVDLGRGDESRPTLCMLVLPKAAAEEICDLFSHMMADIYASRAGASCVDALQNPMDAPATADGPLPPESLDDQELKEAAWTTYFRQFSADFAQILKDLDSGAPGGHTGSVPMAMYLLKRRSWSTASFLLNRCLASGVRVTWGPFVLSESDLGPEQLERDFSSHVQLVEANGQDSPMD